MVTLPIDNSSPAIRNRSRRLSAVHLGLRVVDVLFPVAQGQRELIIGDRQTGKSSVGASALLTQQYRNGYSAHRKLMLAVWSVTGQRVSVALRFLSVFTLNEASFYISGLLASVTASMTAQFFGPLSSTTLCELNRNLGHHTLAVYDDLSKHAVAYRQLSLFLKKPAGREAFPSDVFYLHARLLERSCSLDSQSG